MGKGTPSMGKHNKKLHIPCRRCGRHSYHIKKHVCAACNYGKSPKLRKYNWQTRKINGSRKY